MHPSSFIALPQVVLSLLLFLSTGLLLRADDVIFFKNSGMYRMYVWINGSYQGWVDGGGTTVYMPSEGFVTQDSGFQEDGTLRITRSHGGWEERDTLEFHACTAVFEKEGVRTAYYSGGIIPYQRDDKRLGFTCGEDAPPPTMPSDYEKETAGKMQGGKEPRDLLGLLSSGKEEVGGGFSGSVSGNAVFPLYYAGYKKQEKIDLTGVDILGTIQVTERLLVIETWDHGTFDGDKVAVLLNGISIYSPVHLTNNKQILQMHLKEGRNLLEIIALNEGSLGMNTASFNVYSKGQLLTSKEWNLETGEKAILLVIKGN